MKKRNSIFKVLMAAAMLVTAISCKYELVPEPSGKKGSGRSDISETIQPPAKLVVSNGNYRSIELNWTASKNAVQYQIFSAKTPYDADSFTQEGETEGAETTFTYENESAIGITKYYMVKAVNYYGDKSRGSKIVAGTTLDVPIITDISASEDGTSVDVQWWMGNCSEDTYANDIQYTVSVYNQNKVKIPGLEFIVDGTESNYVVTGLSPRTEYYFTVEAKKTGSEQNSEISDFTNTETAHKIIPDAVKNLTATKGTNKNNVVLSWILPDSVDYYDKTTKQYSSNPIYFTIQRKLLGEDDSAYKTIESYIGCGTSSGLKFYCDTSSTSDATKLSVTGNAEGTKNESYPSYISGSIITYTDTDANVSAGKQYTYRVQSYTDYASSEITSETSIASADGWKISSPTFKAESLMTKDEETVTSIEVDFNTKFNDFAEYYENKELDYPYSYVITSTKTDFTGTSYEESVLYNTNSLKELNSKIYTFTNPSDTEAQGYYIYKLYILNASEDEITGVPVTYLECITSSNIITVTDDASLIPEISNFIIKDGYKNKFILSWDAIEGAVYTVSWKNYVNNELTDTESKTLTSSDYTTSDNGKTISFIHEAESGDSRLYTLNISKTVTIGTSTVTIPNTKEYDSQSKTLGTAVPEMASPDYKTITVSWPKVQMADAEYTITADYSNGSSILDSNYEISENNDTEVVTCIITDPVGYNNISKSGLPVNFTVTAKNTSTNDTTSSSITVRTLGPALIGTSVSSEIQARTLSASWNSVEGASGYIIYRTKYECDEDSGKFNYARSDYYYCSSDGNLKESGNDVPSTRAKVVIKNGTYTLTDYDADVTDDTSAYEINQSQISWGIPFGYVVLPVKGDVTDFTFGSDSDYLKVTGGKAGVIYTSALNEKKTATFGYGLNVTAAKSESASAVKITWAKPYNASLIPTVYKMPFNKEENHDYTATWTLVKELAAGATSYEDVLSVDDIASAFVYAVQYQAPRTSNFSASYRENLASSMENTETKNKGYLLTLKNFAAEYGGTGTSIGNESYYQENITWNKVWDYEERALGPDSFTIDIKNRNLASTMNWTTIANGVITDELQTITPVTNFSDTTVAKMASGDGITIKPAGLTAGTATETNGLLKVLRDAKHYYSVNLKRGDNEAVRQAADNTIYAYRQISNEELCKCVGLIIADSLYKCGVPNRKTYSTSGHTGDFKLACSTGTTDANRVQWQCSDYTNKYTKANTNDDMGSLNSFLTLNSATSSFEEKGIYGETLYYLPELEIEVKGDSDIGLSSYSGTVTFTAGGCSWSIFSTPSNLKNNLTISINSKTVISISDDETSMYKYFPYDLGNKHESPDSTVNTSLQTYQGDWWN